MNNPKIAPADIRRLNEMMALARGKDDPISLQVLRLGQMYFDDVAIPKDNMKILRILIDEYAIKEKKEKLENKKRQLNNKIKKDKRKDLNNKKYILGAVMIEFAKKLMFNVSEKNDKSEKSWEIYKIIRDNAIYRAKDGGKEKLKELFKEIENPK